MMPRSIAQRRQGSAEARRKRQPEPPAAAMTEDKIDESLEESFPASDPNDDIVEVALEGLDHLIPKPRDIYVEDAPGGLVALEIVDADEVRQIVKLRDPLMLPAPSQMK